MTYRGEEYDFGDPNQFIDNPEQRTPCIVMCDTSTSMAGGRIDQLNRGLHALVRAVSSDSLTLSRVELAIGQFGNTVGLAHPFATADRIRVPTLVAHGSTPMGAAMTLAADTVTARAKEYRKAGIACLVPLVFLISDGEPNDDWKGPAQRIAEMERKKQLALFPIGVDGADIKMMSSIGERPALMLRSANFLELFQWMGELLCQYSMSRPGDRVPVPTPSWAEVRT